MGRHRFRRLNTCIDPSLAQHILEPKVGHEVLAHGGGDAWFKPHLPNALHDRSVPLWWGEAHAHLTKDEPGPVVEQFGPLGITSREDLFQTLVRSIVGQQISVLAADAIWEDWLNIWESDMQRRCSQPTSQALQPVELFFDQKASYIYGLVEQSEPLLNQPWMR